MTCILLVSCGCGVGRLKKKRAINYFELSGYQTIQAIQADDFDICSPVLKRDNGKFPTNGDVTRKI